MKVGDLVLGSFEDEDDLWLGAGVVLSVRNDVEIPPLIEVMWDSGYISSVYQDELKIVNESR